MLFCVSKKHHVCYISVISMHESSFFIQLMLSWFQRAKLMVVIEWQMQQHRFHNYKANTCKGAAGWEHWQSNCAPLRTDPFIADLCLSTSHSTADCGSKRIDLLLSQETFGYVGHSLLSAFKILTRMKISIRWG